MLIPLTNPIWTRLYGPYGLQDVAGDLSRLSAGWDSAVAGNLFWERLHHQETLYPATYAALPWLIAIAEQQPAARREVLIFLSWIVYCATSQQVGKDERYVGLSTDPAQHHFKWIAREQWLTEADMSTLKVLADWMEAHIPRIAEDCIAEMAAETNRMTVAHLSWAPLCNWGGSEAARAVEMFSQEEEIDYIRDELDLGDADLDALHRLAVVASGQVWLRELAFLLDGKERLPEQSELPLA